MAIASGAIAIGAITASPHSFVQSAIYSASQQSIIGHQAVGQKLASYAASQLAIIRDDGQASKIGQASAQAQSVITTVSAYSKQGQAGAQSQLVGRYSITASKQGTASGSQALNVLFASVVAKATNFDLFGVTTIRAGSNRFYLAQIKQNSIGSVTDKTTIKTLMHKE